MKWYLSKLVFQIICGEGDHLPQFDEQLRLVQGINKKDAFQKAHDLGYLEEDSFMNNKQQLVCWKFVNISELYEIADFVNGAELYSRIEEKDNAAAYIQIVNEKAENLFFTHTSELLQLA